MIHGQILDATIAPVVDPHANGRSVSGEGLKVGSSVHVRHHARDRDFEDLVGATIDQWCEAMIAAELVDEKPCGPQDKNWVAGAEVILGTPGLGVAWHDEEPVPWALDTGLPGKLSQKFCAQAGLVAKNEERAVERILQRLESIDAHLDRRREAALRMVVAHSSLAGPRDCPFDLSRAVAENHDRRRQVTRPHSRKHVLKNRLAL